MRRLRAVYNMRWLLAYTAFILVFLLGVFAADSDWSWWVWALIGIGTWEIFTQLLDRREKRMLQERNR